MAGNAQLSFAIKAVSEANKVLKDVQADLDGVTNSADKGSGKLSGLGNVMGGALKVGALGAAAGLGALGVAAGIGIKSLIEHEKVDAQTEAALKSTGNAANVTAKQIADLAGAIELKTGIDDVAIQTGQNLLLTFTNISNQAGKGNDIFDQTTKIMTDMSVALGTDASGSAIQLGKALNDPIKGVTALTKVGVSFTDEQKNQIKTMQESGDLMGAQKIILAELTKEFGGSAEAAGKTFAGQLNILKATFEDVAAEIMSGILPVMTHLVQLITTKVMPVVHDVAAIVKDQLGKAFEEIKPTLQDAADILKDQLPKAVETLRGAFEDLKPTLLAIGSFMVDQLGPAWAQLQQLMDGLKPILQDVTKFFKENELAMAALGLVLAALLIALFPIPAAIIAIIAGGTLLLAHWDEIRAGIDAQIEKFNDLIHKVEEIPILGEIFKATFETIVTVVTTQLAILQKIVETAIALVINTIQIAIAIFKGDWDKAWNEIKDSVGLIFQAMVQIIGLALDAMVQLLTDLPPRLLAALGDLGGLLVGAGKALIQGLLDGIEALWRDKLGPWLIGLPGLMTGAIGDLGGIMAKAIMGGFKGAWNALGGAINDAIPNSLNYSIPGINLPSPLKDIPGIDVGLNLPDNPIPMLYDQGGWLPTGLSLAVNNTGRPERILGPGEGGHTFVYAPMFSNATAGEAERFIDWVIKGIQGRSRGAGAVGLMG